MSILWDLGILAMGRLGAPPAGGDVSPHAKQSGHLSQRGQPQIYPTSVHNIEVTQASHKNPSRLVGEWNDLV